MSYLVQSERFSDLEGEWQALLTQNSSHRVFYTPGWQRVWWEEFGAGWDLHLLSVRRDGLLVGIAPLMQRGPTISSLCDPEVCDYSDIIAAAGEEGVYAALLDYLAPGEWQALELPCLPGDSPTLTHLVAAAKAKGLRVRTEVRDVCPRVELPPTWDEYLASLSKKQRHELRRKIRRLDEHGSSYRYYAVSTPQSLSQDVDDFIRLHRLSNPAKAEFMSPEMERFFHHLAAHLMDNGELKLYFLEVAGVRVSATFCFDYNDEFSLYNSGFDPAYSALSVGLLLKAFCLKDAIAAGKKRFDFLRGPEPYKYHLGGEDFEVYRCTIYKD